MERAAYDPRAFGLNAEDLRALADAFYPEDDQCRHRLTTDYRNATRAGLIRSRLRRLADAIDEELNRG